MHLKVPHLELAAGRGRADAPVTEESNRGAGRYAPNVRRYTDRSTSREHTRLNSRERSSRIRTPHSGRPFDLANDVPICDVLRFLGVSSFIEEAGRLHCNCPLCPGPDERELVVGGRANVATCFGDCRRSYTAVDLVMAVRGVTPREAVGQLAEEFGFLGFPEGRS